jgi:hypothetical protein
MKVMYTVFKYIYLMYAHFVRNDSNVLTVHLGFHNCKFCEMLDELQKRQDLQPKTAFRKTVRYSIEGVYVLQLRVTGWLQRTN